MSIINKLRLIGGFLFVLALLGALLLYLNNSMAHVSSVSATLLSDTYTVGTDYSGIITQQYVSEGQHVNAGDKLFAIQSSVLDADLTNGTVSKNNLGYSLDGVNNIILKSTGSGTVSQIDYIAGSFVPANKEIATITKDGSLYVQADYSLSPPDYARIKDGDVVSVTLPNDEKVPASVFNIAVQSSGQGVQTVIKARITGLDGNSAFTTGTPVTAELHLNGKTLYNSVRDDLQKIFQPKG